MAYEDIAFEVVDQVAIITLKRPEHLNAFSGRMGIDLAAAYREFDLGRWWRHFRQARRPHLQRRRGRCGGVGRAQTGYRCD